MDGTSQFKTGELSGSTSAKQVLNAAGEGVSAAMVRIKAAADNGGKVYVGFSNAVTKADGTTDSTTGYPLAAGEEQWFFVDNISRLWIICDNAGDDIVWVAFK